MIHPVANQQTSHLNSWDSTYSSRTGGPLEEHIGKGFHITQSSIKYALHCVLENTIPLCSKHEIK